MIFVSLYLIHCADVVTLIVSTAFMSVYTSAYTFKVIDLAAFTICFATDHVLTHPVSGSTVFAFGELLPLHGFYVLSLFLLLYLFDFYLVNLSYFCLLHQLSALL